MCKTNPLEYCVKFYIIPKICLKCITSRELPKPECQINPPRQLYHDAGVNWMRLVSACHKVTRVINEYASTLAVSKASKAGNQSFTMEKYKVMPIRMSAWCFEDLGYRTR